MGSLRCRIVTATSVQDTVYYLATFLLLSKPKLCSPLTKPHDKHAIKQHSFSSYAIIQRVSLDYTSCQIPLHEAFAT